MIPSAIESPPPRRIREFAPDVSVTIDGGATRLRKARDTPLVLVFHSPHWDPARADEVAGYGAANATTVLIRNDDVVARAFGVAGRSAVYVVDGDGFIVWRHVAGVDGMSGLTLRAREPVAIHPEQSGNGWTRRAFVARAVGVAIALALEPTFGRARAAAESVTSPSVGEAVPVTLTVNGRTLSLTLEPRVTLLDALREYAGLTGTKKGCDHGQCGACTVHIDGRRTLSCLTFAVMQQGKPITTIEGLATGDTLHPMQQAFIDHDGFQCGYCTSGQIMSATAMVREPWGLGDDDVREAMSGNICRCGAYPGIVAAVQDVRHNGGGQSR